MPIIVISARGQEEDKVERARRRRRRLPDEAVRRRASCWRGSASRSATRRDGRAGGRSRSFAIGELDSRSRQATRSSCGGGEVHLTPNEYKLLTTLVKHAGKVLTHRQLLKEVWGPAYEQTHYLRVYMGQLRHKLEPDPARPRYLMNEPGVGYRLKVRGS